MTYITRERRAEIRKRIEAATPGPWVSTTYGASRAVTEDNGRRIAYLYGSFADRTDAEAKASADFIAEARTDVPDLLEAYEDVIKLARKLSVELAAILPYTGHLCAYETSDSPDADFCDCAIPELRARSRGLLSNPLLSEITKEGE